MRIELLVKTGRFNEFVDLVKHATSKYMHSNIDLSFVFLKAANKKLSLITDF